MQKIRQETEQEWAKQKVKCWLSSECFLMFLLLKTEEMARLDMNSIRQKKGEMPEKTMNKTIWKIRST